MTSTSPGPARRPPIAPNPDLYPDLESAGSLAQALQSMAADLGLDLGEVVRDRPDSRVWAGVVSAVPDREKFGVNIGAVERWFLISAWGRGFNLITGSTKDLAEVARAAAAWRRGASLREIKSEAAFVTVTELAEAHERGAADAVAVKWRLLREEMAGPIPFEAVRDLVEVAYAHPKLRQLYPFTSHWTLHLSTCVGYPFSWTVPFVDPLPGGRYRVCGPKRGTIIGEADTPQQAVALVVENLPADCGPAIDGTGNDV